MNTIITPAIETDLDEILCLAKSFDLDLENVLRQQFVVAKKEESIIGFGRLSNYPDCTEVATVGVIPEERHKGIGTAIVNELIQIGPKEIFVTCVIPNFFRRLGFETVKHYPSVLQKKVDFCKLYNFKEDEIFVMKIEKNESVRWNTDSVHFVGEKQRNGETETNTKPMAERINMIDGADKWLIK